MGPNGLILAGYWFFEGMKEIEALKEWGIGEAVKEVGYVTEHGGETDKKGHNIEGGADKK